MKQRLQVVLTLLLALVVQIGFAQEKTITGTVTDGEGMPLPGVNVIVEGTNRGTQTNFDGEYNITAQLGETLVFSYIGFESVTYDVSNIDVIDVTLTEDAAELEEVIVVGYGTATKQSFTGTADVVDSEAIERKSVSNISQALAGESAGVRVINTSGQPGTEATIRIRGIGSVSGNRDPLYVVNGVPFNGNISSINPADIASTTILKDAAATAIYGSRGANGVIVINTKDGVAGESTIEVEVKTGQNFSLLPRYNTIESPERYMELSWEALRNQGRLRIAADDPFDPEEGNISPVEFANRFLFSGDLGIDPKYNIWNVAGGAEFIDPETGMVQSGVSRVYDPEDWEDYAFQPSNRTETNLRISGGSENTTYYTSFGYLQSEGYSINSDYERYSARLGVSHDVKDWLSGTMDVNYSVSESNEQGQSEDSGSIFWFVDNLPPIYPLFLRDDAGERISDPYYGGYQYDYGVGRGFGAQTNAIADAVYGMDNYQKHELSTNSFLNFRFTDHLNFETRFGTQYYNDQNSWRNDPFYGPSASIGGSVGKFHEEHFSFNFLQLLRYTRSFGDHSLQALAAHESNSWKREYFFASNFNLVRPRGTELNNAVGSNPAGSYTEDYTLESYFAQLRYDYDDTYFLSGTIRRDGSSRFVQDKWGTFGSVGGAWVMSNEDFMENQNVVDYLKLKASYGLIGEQEGVGFYPGYTTWAINNLDGNPSFAIDLVGNPELTWETSNMFQAGVEFNIGGFLDASLDFYNKVTDDLIFERRVGPSIGYEFMQVNDGALLNRGFEFTFNANIIQQENFYLTANLNGAINTNELLRMPIDPSTGEEKILDVQGYFGWSEGHSIYDFYLREYAGVDPATGESLWNTYFDDVNSNGSMDGEETPIGNLYPFLAENPDANIERTVTSTYSDATQKYVDKSAVPDVRGAFNLNTGFGGFNLSAQFLYQIGGHAYDFVYARLMHNDRVGGNNWHTDIANRWQEPGDITNVPRLSSDYTTNDSNASSPSTRFITKSDYLALNNVRLGYTVPTNFVETIGVSNLSIWVSGDNLFLMSERDGFNPSTAEAGGSDWYTYSPLSTITAGVRVKF